MLGFSFVTKLGRKSRGDIPIDDFASALRFTNIKSSAYVARRYTNGSSFRFSCPSLAFPRQIFYYTTDKYAVHVVTWEGSEA